MRNVLAPIALAATLLMGSAAFAGQTGTTGANTATTAGTQKADKSDKKADCKASWNAQATHTGTKKDFMKACKSKG